MANINQALILLYANDDNYLRYGLMNGQGTIYVNHVHEVAGAPRPQTHHAYGSSDVCLRIQRQGNGATMWYSADSLTWAEHLTIASLDFTPTSVGLVAFDGSEPASASVAYYDYFTIRSDAQSGVANLDTVAARPFLATRGNPVGAGGSVHLDFVTPSPGRVTLRAFDACGTLVATILDAELPAGRHTADWRRDEMRAGRNAPAGVYFVALTGSGAPASTRVLLTR